MDVWEKDKMTCTCMKGTPSMAPQVSVSGDIGYKFLLFFKLQPRRINQNHEEKEQQQTVAERNALIFLLFS